MKDSPPISQVRYKCPPIIERVLSVDADVSQETFFAKFESWKQIIGEQFPEYDPIKDWRLNIETKEDTPILTDIQPELLITHRFWRHNKKNKRFLSMRLLPGQLTLNLHRDQDDPHSFDELYSEMDRWLPQWMNHFEAKGASVVTLAYINLISSKTTPQFIAQNGGILVGSVLRVFAGVPSQHLGIIPPYDCQMGLMIDPNRQATFGLRVLGLPVPKGQSAAIRVDFQAIVAKPIPSLTAPQVLSEAIFLHTVMCDQFESVFTDTAKQSFEPIKQL